MKGVRFGYNDWQQRLRHGERPLEALFFLPVIYQDPGDSNKKGQRDADPVEAGRG